LITKEPSLEICYRLKQEQKKKTELCRELAYLRNGPQVAVLNTKTLTFRVKFREEKQKRTTHL
jgi:hypothetical protein